jgi:MATE family multidrug resistance protein
MKIHACLHRVNGFATGVLTLGGQAFGAGEYKLVGAVTQRALLLNLLLSVLVLFGWAHLDSLMVALGMDG